MIHINARFAIAIGIGGTQDICFWFTDLENGYSNDGNGF
jgi:hypothetical protein